MPARLALCALALLGSTALAGAQMPVTEPYLEEPAPLEPSTFDYGESDIVLELGAGGLYAPEYPGSDNYELSAYPIIGLDYLSIPGIGSFGGPSGLGFSIGPSFGYIAERESGDIDGLRGLDDVDAVYQAGVRISYEWQNAEVYAAARYAFGGVDAVVGEFGGNLIARPTDKVVVRAGPFARLASEDYVDAYFGVSEVEFARTGLQPHDAGGGFTGVGVMAEAKYEIFTDTFLNLDASYERLVGDAGDSPLTQDENQYTFGLGISRRFSLDLW